MKLFLGRLPFGHLAYPRAKQKVQKKLEDEVKELHQEDHQQSWPEMNLIPTWKHIWWFCAHFILSIVFFYFLHIFSLPPSLSFSLSLSLSLSPSLSLSLSLSLSFFLFLSLSLSLSLSIFTHSKVWCDIYIRAVRTISLRMGVSETWLFSCWGCHLHPCEYWMYWDKRFFWKQCGTKTSQCGYQHFFPAIGLLFNYCFAVSFWTFAWAWQWRWYWMVANYNI